jgi:hypothetical protein
MLIFSPLLPQVRTRTSLREFDLPAVYSPVVQALLQCDPDNLEECNDNKGSDSQGGNGAGDTTLKYGAAVGGAVAGVVLVAASVFFWRRPLLQAVASREEEKKMVIAELAFIDTRSTGACKDMGTSATENAELSRRMSTSMRV